MEELPRRQAILVIIVPSPAFYEPTLSISYLGTVYWVQVVRSSCAALPLMSSEHA